MYLRRSVLMFKYNKKKIGDLKIKTNNNMNIMFSFVIHYTVSRQSMKKKILKTDLNFLLLNEHITH